MKPAVGAGSVDTHRFTDPKAARAHAATLLEAGRDVLIQPYDAQRWRTAKPRWCSSVVSSHTRSPRGRSCLRRASRRLFDESGTYAAESLSAADPTSRCGRRVCDPGRRLARIWVLLEANCSTPESISSAERTIRCCSNSNWSNRRWAGASLTPRLGNCGNVLSPSRWSQRWSAGASARSPGRSPTVAPGARRAAASTPTVPRWPRCRPLRPPHASPPGPAARRCGTGSRRSDPGR